MRPSNTTKYVAALTRSKIGLENIKLAIEILGLLFLLATVGASVWLAFLQRDANGINRQALAFSQRSLELAQKSVDFTQQSLALTQQSVKASEQALRIATKANEISEKGLTAANTPWLSVSKFAFISSNGFHVHYSVTNNSNIPAQKVWAVCAIQGHPLIIDRAILGSLDDSEFAIPGGRSADYNVDMLSPEDTQPIAKEIDEGALGVSIVVSYTDGVGSRRNFIETFSKENGAFVIADEQYDVDRIKMEKVLALDQARSATKKK